MELHHADRPCVARELRHHLASGQIPELGAGWGGSEGEAGPCNSPPFQPELFIYTPPSTLDGLKTHNPNQEGGEDLA